ncbi:uncharacterized protein BDZ99DRAFT_469470 [Mytilinidion resinicola]|uniref:Mitochondrial ribosomal protein-like protein n=1 Tax=Mytilinidion resinicola TaxID=574789 RepID=A0A6A6XYU6_9PEZI|nr:uncharacterized protein BDZ99DRAFT_469470 [Mytilinidion resinicola]KAF2801736.1 hypothetical protein BDZ99DRAFT_469470 [Mytilinidion resinicola]
MATQPASMRPLARLNPLLRHARACNQRRSFLSITPEDIRKHKPLPGFSSLTSPRQPVKVIPTFPPRPAPKHTCPDPVAFIEATQLAQLDPTGARTRLFAKYNSEGAKVGDVLLVRLKNGDPFAGVCINIRRRGVDTAVLLRGQLTRVGVEMWYKIYSPNVEGIEVVQRMQKRARRAKLYYLRQPRHDRGSVENVVRQYMKTRAALGVGTERRKEAGLKQKKSKGKKKQVAPAA